MKSELTINNIHLKFTHLDKLLFPEQGMTKGEVIEYYLKISPLFLRYVKKRPLTLQRFPKGIQISGFIQKHADFFPEWIERVSLPAKAEPMFYVIANKKADLGYLVNLNTITFHSAFSTIDKIEYPDMLVWDLDPSDSNFNKIMEVAFKIKEFADLHHIKLLLKTTGSKGLHLYAPLNKQLHFDEIHLFSKIVANILARQFPKQITTEQQKVNRKGRVLIDYVRNSYGQTAVSPYSLRALPGAPVATPITWDELGTTVLSSKQFNLANIFDRLKEKGDIWRKAKVMNPNIHTLILQINQEYKKIIS